MNTFTVKGGEGCTPSDLTKLRGDTLIILGHYVRYCAEKNLPCQLTNLVKKFLQSRTDTHLQGRAFDASVKGWKQSDIDDCIRHMEDVVGHLGAISKRDGIQRVVVYHDAGLGPHLHFQCRR